MAAAPEDRSARQLPAGVTAASVPRATASPAHVFDARALRRVETAPAASDPTDWTEAEISGAVTDYARYRGHSSPASGVPDAVVTDLPDSGDRYLGDAVAVDGGLVIRVDEGTRLLGWEQVPLLRTRELTVRADATGRLQVARDQPVDGGDLWDITGLRGVRSGSALVLGDVDQDTLAAMARMGSAAVRRASALWGADWDHRLVIVAPRTLGEFAGQLGAAPVVARSFAAVTTGYASWRSGQSPPEQEFVGSRVFVNPDSWQQMSDDGRLFVLSHEATHVAAQGASRAAPPDWLAEGVADEVGSRASGITEDELVGPIVEEVRRSGPPDALPGNEDFSGKDAEAGARAYAGAVAGVLLIERTYGRAALARFFHDVTSGTRGGLSPETATARSMRDDLGTTPAAFTRAWRAELRRLAAH